VRGMRTHRAVFARSAAGAVGCILYAVVGGAGLTHALFGSVAGHKAESAQSVESAEMMRSGSSAAPLVIGITVADAYCEGYCEDSFAMSCTTSKELISADWIVVPAADFGSLYRELGCEPRAK
jgi:hypothetical protein